MTAPAVLSFPTQPAPIKTKITPIPVGDGTYTAISRLFKPEDVPLCQLCPVCTACTKTGLCQIVARRNVAPRDAPLYVFQA